MAAAKVLHPLLDPSTNVPPVNCSTSFIKLPSFISNGALRDGPYNSAFSGLRMYAYQKGHSKGL